MKVGHMVLRNFADEIIALTDDYDKLKAENAALRAGQGRWPEADDSPSGEQVPRTITAEELEAAAEALASRDGRLWRVADESDKKQYRDYARAAFEAVGFTVGGGE